MRTALTSSRLMMHREGPGSVQRNAANDPLCYIYVLSVADR